MRRCFSLLIACILFLSAGFSAFSEESIGDITGEIPDTGSHVVDRTLDPTLPSPFSEDAELLEIWFPNIHDCDAALLRFGDTNVMIDCGTESVMGRRVVKLLELTGTKHLNAIYNSHPHNDHLLGFLRIIEAGIKVDALYICFHEFYTTHMERAVKAARKNKIPIVHYGDEDEFSIGDASMHVYMKGDAEWDLNSQSAVMRVLYGDRSILFTADIEPKTQSRLAKMIYPESLKSDILKYPHHGIKALSESFLSVVQPEIAIITNMDMYRTAKAVYHTSRAGAGMRFTASQYLHLATDGNVWLMEYLNAEDFPFYEEYMATHLATETDLLEADEEIIQEE